MARRAGEAAPILRFAVAGLGAAGCMMIPALLKHPYIKITAAADTDPEPLEKFRGDFQAATFRRVEELCKSPNVDAIYVATPTQCHTEHALMALECRKHVVLEKPMALSLADADAMIAAAERSGVQLEEAEFAWKIWSLEWQNPSPGEHTIVSRAIDRAGNIQPAMDDPRIAKKRTYWESNGQVTRRIRLT